MATTSQLLSSLERASLKFQEALSFPNTEPMRESLIQRFEYTFELSWKVMSSILVSQGRETAGVRNVIRAAAQLGLIQSPQKWLEFADARNATSHIYKEEIAEMVYQTACSGFFEHVSDLITEAKKMSE